MSERRLAFYLANGAEFGVNTTPYRRLLLFSRHFDLSFLTYAPPVYIGRRVNTVPPRAFPCKFPVIGKYLFLGWCWMQVWRGVRAAGRRGVLVFSSPQPLATVAGWLVSRTLRVPWIADIYDLPTLGREAAPCKKSWRIRARLLEARRFEELVERVLRHADLVICALHPGALAEYRIKPSRLIEVFNGVNVQEFPPLPVQRAADQVLLLYVGHVRKIRGMDTLLESAGILRVDVPNFRLLLVGPVPVDERRWLMDQIRSYGLSQQVEVLGELPYEEVRRHLASADICLLPIPSKHELDFRYPLKIFEYMAAAKPIAASRLSGVCRILEEGNNAMLFEPGNAHDLARVLKSLATDPILRQRLGESARRSVARFDWSCVDRQIESSLKALLEADLCRSEDSPPVSRQ